MKKLLLFGAIALSTATFAQVPNYVPTNGLVGWWPFNGNANDESGNGNNGTVNGATLTADRFGNPNSAYDFDGVDDFIEINDISAIENMGSMTWSAWITCRSNPNNPSELSSNRIICKELENDANNRMTLIVNSNSNAQTFQFILNSTTNSSAVSSEPIIFDSLYFITVVYNYDNPQNTDQLQIYLNANLILQSVNGAVPSLTPNNPYNLKFGRHDNTATSWDGKIDDIGIWNRALTECEIVDLYNSQLGFLNTTSTQTETALDSYTWPVNNQIYTQSGTYTAVIPNAAGCDSTITLDLTMQFTGIGEKGANLLAVYPNPTTSFLTIEGEGIQSKEYAMVDIQGRIVLNGTFKSNKETIDLKTLARGQYMLRIEGKELKVVKE